MDRDEVDEAPLGINADQLHSETVANLEATMAAFELAFDNRALQPDPRALG